jgi:tRNA (mo5U34)-methyltransferase
MRSPAALARRLAGRAKAPAAGQPLPAAGFPAGASAGYVEQLDDDELALVNELLPWRCFTVDSRGRRFGDRAWTRKRDVPQDIPDWRVGVADERFGGLADKSVLEVGCFEGVHTIALCRAAREVTAVDAHIVNVVKTVVRCNLYGHRPAVYPSNVERWADDPGFAFDVVFHVGVLYHLHDPVAHVARLGRVCRVGLLLDTHVATDEQATETMVAAGGRAIRYHSYAEQTGADAVFAGMDPESRWLRLDDLESLLHDAGFTSVQVVDQRDERNGRRVTLAATKPRFDSSF